MNKERAPEVSDVEAFDEIIRKEYGENVPRKLGHGAVRTVIPFGDQFMERIPELPPSPTATGRGGQTVTTNGGRASLDDSSSNDVS